MVNLCWQVLFQTTCKKHILNKSIATSKSISKSKSMTKSKSFDDIKKTFVAFTHNIKRVGSGTFYS